MSIAVENLTHVYMPGSPFETTALRNITLKILDGEFIGIIGPTGSGKSTLVQHINGLLKPTSGRLVVEGVDMSKKADLRFLRQRVGLVFQYPEYQVFEETVCKDVAFGPENMGLPAEETARRVNDALLQAGLDPVRFGDRSPFELSGGQRRRVALAGVLAMEPTVLILDEPTAGLDPEGRKDFLSLLGDLNKSKGVTVLMISHNMDEVARMADRVLVLCQGEVAFFDTPSEVFDLADRLRAFHLDVPLMVKLSESLRARGVAVPKGLLTMDQMEAFLLARLKGGSGHAG